MIDIQAPQAKGLGLITRVAGIAGFLIIIGIGIWGSLAIARHAPGAFSSFATAITSIFVPANEKITLSVPSLTVKSGETFQISWEHAHKSGKGVYTFRYDCIDGVSLTSPDAGGVAQPITCNTPFTLVQGGTSVMLTATSNKNHFADAMLFIDYAPETGGQATVTGSSMLTIVNDNPVTTPTPTTPNPTTPHNTAGPQTSQTFPLGGGTTVSNPNGNVDLAVRVIEQGIVDKDTGVFTATTSPSRTSLQYRIAVRFAVENKGTKTSPMFTFNAVLPTLPSSIFSSPSEQALGPGDRIEFTLGFDQVADQDNGTFTVNVDPAGSINESDENNNIVHYTVTSHK